MTLRTFPQEVVRPRIDWAVATLRARGWDVTEPQAITENAWSLIAPFRTPSGDVYLKYVRGAFLQEPAITRALHDLAPNLVPGIVADNPDLGCWLVQGAGTGIPLADLVRHGHVPPLLRAHAGLQRLTRNGGPDWLERGAKDLSPGLWQAYLGQIRSAREALELDNVPQPTINGLERAEPALARLCKRLGALNVPNTVVHMDLRQTNIKLGRGPARIIDWGDAGFGPAFLDPVPLFSETATLGLGADDTCALSDEALSPWTDLAPLPDLREAQRLCRIAYPLLYAHGLIHARPSWDRTLKPSYYGLLAFYLGAFLSRLSAPGD